MVEHLLSAPDNELLNAAKVTVESTLVCVAEMLCERIFEGVPDATDPCFLVLVSYLACATKQ